MELFLCSFLLVLSSFCIAQEWKTPEYIKKFNYQEVIGNIEKIPENQLPDVYAKYPNGKKGVYKLIANETKMPKKAIRKKIEGTVIVKYVVGADGYVRDIAITQSVNKLLDNAAIQVIKSMKRWIPGKVDGKKCWI